MDILNISKDWTAVERINVATELARKLQRWTREIRLINMSGSTPDVFASYIEIVLNWPIETLEKERTNIKALLR